MPRSRPPHGSESPSVHVRGRSVPYIERRRVGGRDYYLLDRIGGPLRETYQAFDPRRGPGGDFFLFRTFRGEEVSADRLSILKRLKDDGFPRVWDWKREGERLDVVMTWVEGIPLAEYLGNIRGGRRPLIDPSHALRLAQGLAAAVARLHHKLQIGHGDIQPSNVILTRDPSRLLLIDFGSAWTVQRTALRPDGDGHHRAYAAPELQQPGPVAGFAADQFSVSVLLYEMLTMEVPYGGLGGKAGRPEFVNGTGDALIPPSRVSPACGKLPQSLRDPLDRVVLRGLALRPEDRYPDRHLWLKDLSEVSARFRLRPEPTLGLNLLSRLIGVLTPRLRD